MSIGLSSPVREKKNNKQSEIHFCQLDFFKLFLLKHEKNLCQDNRCKKSYETLNTRRVLEYNFNFSLTKSSNIGVTSQRLISLDELTFRNYELGTRRDNIGIRPSLVPAEAHLHIPDYVFYHPAIKELERLLADLLILENVQCLPSTLC